MFQCGRNFWPGTRAEEFVQVRSVCVSDVTWPCDAKLVS